MGEATVPLGAVRNRGNTVLRSSRLRLMAPDAELAELIWLAVVIWGCAELRL
jgi:hypothetical protein